jgi:uncharacterized membrane protein
MRGGIYRRIVLEKRHYTRVGSATSGRLGYLDWGRGLCVVLMIATHGLYGWVRPDDHAHPFFQWMRLVGGFPGAAFLFISGVVLALAAEGKHRRGEPPRAVLRAGLARGLEILGYAFLFRLWMFASGRFNAPWDLLRVDILNCIGASLLVVGVVALPWPRRAARIAATVLVAVAIAALTPFTWDSAPAHRLPAGLAGYVDGRQPGSFFPPFPWAGFAALGATAGVLLASWRGRGREAHLFGGMAALGAIMIPLALWADRVLPDVYPRYDFWHTSPAYFAVKAGIVLLVMAAAYVFDKIPGQGPIRQLGRTSLLVYWVHLEIIYGDHVVPGVRGNLPLGQAVVAVGILMLAMLALSYARTAGWPLIRSRAALAKA